LFRTHHILFEYGDNERIPSIASYIESQLATQTWFNFSPKAGNTDVISVPTIVTLTPNMFNSKGYGAI